MRTKKSSGWPAPGDRNSRYFFASFPRIAIACSSSGDKPPGGLGFKLGFGETWTDSADAGCLRRAATRPLAGDAFGSFFVISPFAASPPARGALLLLPFPG